MKIPFRDVVHRVKEDRNLESVIDALLDIPDEKIDRQLKKQLAEHPHATATQLAHDIEKRFIKQSSLSSSAVGIGASAPGAGTAIAVGATSIEILAFATEAVFYILSMAKLCGIDVTDKKQRRVLVLSALLGDEGAELISQQLGLSTLNWARQSLTSLSSPTLSSVNRILVKYTRRKIAQRMSGRLLGRLIPFGIGAVVGWISGKSAAKKVIEGAHAALGQPLDQPARYILEKRFHD